ncbi:uncharacterized protein BDV17DRAFT_251526 [Aspergillus undulatus]|uniref:uncharacterized protein n=1 Tax=Aspergillus undulatus TaxID=1810928 RepID=UPI003CCCB8FA
MAKIGGWFLWRSSRADYEWVWWEPGQRELGTYQERGKPVVSRWTRWYDLAMAEAIYNHTSPSIPSPSTTARLHTASPPFASGALSPSDAPHPIMTPIRGPTRTGSSLQEGFGVMPSHSAFSRRQRAKMSSLAKLDTSSHAGPSNGKAFTPVSKCPYSRSLSRPIINQSQSSPYSFSMPCLSQPKSFPKQPMIRSSAISSCKNPGSEGLMPDAMLAFRRSRQYQVWSARMGLETFNCTGNDIHALPKVPPGSPKSAMLGSLSFESTALDRAHQYRQGSKLTSFSDVSDLVLSGDQQYCSDKPISGSRCTGKGVARKEWHSLPLLRGHRPHRPTLLTWQEDAAADSQDLATKPEAQSKEPKCQRRRRLRRKRMPHFIVRAKDWSNWEVRLIHSLDQKLAWISDQLTPGVRPFHFALLANHWLNRETWIVYDPISRVNIEKRRRWGDPRFNVPYPEPTSTPTPKYPKVNHRRSHAPAINSWRDAVNQHRRASGQKPIMEGIELFDSSAEDPPDGKIDPACWVLRRPPQGVSLSARQREEYYEGGAGWQETLNDWQRIKRGYRIRKAIYDGRINRTRAKEIAYGITRCYRQAASKFIPSDSNHGEDASIEFPDEPS